MPALNPAKTYRPQCAWIRSQIGDEKSFGLAYPTRSAVVEARAMYGGVQLGFGAFLLYGAMRPAARVHTLVATLLVVGGLASCRAIGLALAGPDDYNVAAVLYETTTTLLFAVALAREQRADAALGA